MAGGVGKAEEEETAGRKNVVPGSSSQLAEKQAHGMPESQEDQAISGQGASGVPQSGTTSLPGQDQGAEITSDGLALLPADTPMRPYEFTYKAAALRFVHCNVFVLLFVVFMRFGTNAFKPETAFMRVGACLLFEGTMMVSYFRVLMAQSLRPEWMSMFPSSSIVPWSWTARCAAVWTILAAVVNMVPLYIGPLLCCLLVSVPQEDALRSLASKHLPKDEAYNREFLQHAGKLSSSYVLALVASIGVGAIFPYLQDYLPSVAGLMYSLLIAGTEAVGISFLFRTYMKIPDSHTHFLNQDFFLGFMVVVFLVLMDAAKCVTIILATIGRPEDIGSPMQGLITELVAGVLNRTGWQSFVLSLLINTGLPSSLNVYVWKLKYTVGYYKIGEVTGIIFARACLGLPTYYFNGSCVYVTVAYILCMVIQDVLVAAMERFQFVPKWNAQAQMKYAEFGPRDRLMRGYRPDEQGRMVPNVTQLPCPLLSEYMLTGSWSTFFIMFTSLAGNLSVKFLVGLSEEVVPTPSDGALLWHDDILTCC